jgi:4-hydroxyphenylpyruvate dioxygenase-like putative hemolysin
MPVVARPTLFLELIERRGASGFGVANIRWLAKAAEDAIGNAAR